MKKLLLMILCLLLACPVVMAANEGTTYEDGRTTFYLMEDGTAMITRFEAYTHDSIIDIIPSTVYIRDSKTNERTEITVTGISHNAYVDGYLHFDPPTWESFVSSADIPSSIIIIEGNPFENCQCLTDIYVSPEHSTLATIDGVLFEKPTRRLITYPLGYQDKEYIVPDGIKEIGQSAFYGEDDLKTVSLPESLTVINESAFIYCENLKDITLPSNLESIGNYAFWCTNLGRIYIPSSVTFIGVSAFDKDEVTLIVERGSYAAEFAHENNYHYEYIDGGEADMSWLNADTTEDASVETEEVIEDTNWLEDEE